MNPAMLVKATRMAVVPALDGTFRVAGYTDVHTVFYAPFLSRLECDCRAQYNCSHVTAVRIYLEKNNLTPLESTTHA